MMMSSIILSGVCRDGGACKRVLKEAWNELSHRVFPFLGGWHHSFWVFRYSPEVTQLSRIQVWNIVSCDWVWETEGVLAAEG